MTTEHRAGYNIRRWLIVCGLAFTACALVLISLQAGGQVQAAQHNVTVQSPPPQSSYLFRYNSVTHSFYTYTLPIGGLPYGLVVTGTNPTHVWVAESGSNKIGHLIYTDTTHYQFVEYPVTSTTNSRPFQIAVDGNHVWFTERGANRVGRLNAITGQIDEFYGNGLSPNSGLAEIKVASNGWVWIAGQQSDRLIRLVVTSTYQFTEYSNALLKGPFGITIESSNDIWFTMPDAHGIGRFTPSDNLFVVPYNIPTNSSPIELAVTPGFVWFSDLQNNSIDQIEIGTLSIVNPHGPIAAPYGLTTQSSTIFWTTQQNSMGAIGRMVYTSPISVSLDSYPLPTRGLVPTGIDVAADNGVWAAAYAPYRAYLPLVMKNH